MRAVVRNAGTRVVVKENGKIVIVHEQLIVNQIVANVQLQSDWNQIDNSKKDYIKNKPTIPDELSDLSEDSTHRTVTDTEKSTWNNKVDKVTGKGLSEADITSAEKLAITHTNRTSLDNVSGSNTGDETESSIKSKLGITTLSGSNTGDQDLSNLVVKETGKGLSTNDFTDVLETKLNGIADGAEVNVNADWNATSGDALINNKPTTLSYWTEDVNHRTVTDTEKSTWNGKQDALGFTPENVSNKVTSFQVTPDDTHYPSEKLVKDSLLNLYTEVVQFDIDNNNPTYAEGKFFYDKTKHAMSYYNEHPDVTVNLGKEVIIDVKNMTGSTILNGSVVYPTGFADGHVLIGLANAHDKDKCRLIGVVTHDIPDGETGNVTKIGEVGGLDTSSFNSGDIAYLSTTVDGGISKIKPVGASYITRIGAVKIKDVVNGSIVVDIATSEQTVESTQDVGFSTSEFLSISHTDSVNGCTLTLTPDDDEFCFYQYGDKYCKTSDSILLPDEEGLFVVYYNLGTLAYIKNPTSQQIEIIIRNNPVVSYVYWNATDNKSEYVGYELHEIGMSAVTHAYLHFAFGARYMNGLAPNTISADTSGDLAVSAQFGVDSGAIADEDIYLAYAGILSTTGLTIAYLAGTNTTPFLRTTNNTGYSVLTTGTGRLAYNTLSGSNYVLSEVPNGNFVLCHLIAINENNASKRVVAVVGQNQYTTITNARAGASTEIATLKTVGVLPQESKAIATFIFETSNSFSNAVKARVRTISTGVNYVDWRTTYFNGSSSGSAGSGTSSTIFSDGLFQIIDDVDPTKVLTFQNSGITTGNTRTITSPNRNLDLNNPEFDTIINPIFKPVTDSISSIQFKNADNSYAVATLDTINRKMAIGTASMTGTLNLGYRGIVSSDTAINFLGTLSSDTNSVYNQGRMYGQFDSTGYDSARITIASALTNTTWVDTLTVKNGNVGICTNNPSTKLEVVGTVKITDTTQSTLPTTGALVVGGGLGVSGITNIMTGVVPFYALKIGNYSGGAVNSLYTGCIDNSFIYFGSAYYNNASLWRTPGVDSAIIRFDGGIMKFYTNASLTADTDFTPTERMRIYTNGRVGIGTGSVNPLSLLHIAGTNAKFTISNSTSSDQLLELTAGNGATQIINSTYNLQISTTAGDILLKPFTTGKVEANCIIKTTDTTNSTSTITGSIQGYGLGLQGSAFIGGNVVISGNMLKFTGITTAVRDGLTAVAGDVIYNTTTNKHQGFNGSTWNDFY